MAEEAEAHREPEEQEKRRSLGTSAATTIGRKCSSNKGWSKVNTANDQNSNLER